jgi:hypothetical protein
VRALDSSQTLLQQLIRRRDVSYERMAHELEEFARRQGIDGTVSARHLQRLARRERGDGSGSPSALPGTRRLLSEFSATRSASWSARPPRLNRNRHRRCRHCRIRGS